MVSKLVLLSDSTIQPFEGGLQEIRDLLMCLQRKGIHCDLLDAKDMAEAELEKWRDSATLISMREKVGIRQVFGTKSAGGLPCLGSQVPALFVYEGDPEKPVMVYPHESKGKPFTIAGFLKELTAAGD